MICFALLAHEDEGAIRQQIKNIRKYNPKDAFIVFYNGGQDSDFGKKVCQEENVLYCPFSKPLTQRTSGRFFYDIMRWLEERKINYEYLVYLEYDIMFVNEGFREMLQTRMTGYDCLLKWVKKETDPKKATWEPAKLMWDEWNDWRPFFQLDHFLERPAQCLFIATALSDVCWRVFIETKSNGYSGLPTFSVWVK
ncbi:hypothetical protein [Paenibacillus sp. GP183]|uniref:hypothetical protein n=1 Tax=Paenibacillus sp. GP183 TaxID=1882751 RepID=UPI00089BBF29|nr:hypothetical protein [Paenibacillus sp. GP183]SEC69800.1 hypothetical protein SAMN05443246_5039 [Paenibacillus sp. GP183]